jgi:hypothetical protein
MGIPELLITIWDIWGMYTLNTVVDVIDKIRDTAVPTDCFLLKCGRDAGCFKAMGRSWKLIPEENLGLDRLLNP